MNMPQDRSKDMATLPVTLADVRAAAAAIDGAILRTPFNKSHTLSKLTGAEVYIKFENLQFTASFKERGALNKLLSLTDAERAVGVIAASAGNHAQGVAYHAQRLGIPATIVMPSTTPFVKVRQTEDFGANVVLQGERYDETATYTAALATEKGLTLIHPFDDRYVIAGQGTIALEMLDEVPDLDALLVPVGGGGLISGIAVAAKTLRPDLKILGVQAERFPSLYRALRDEDYVARGNSLAEGIAVKTIGTLTLEIARKLVDDVLLVNEDTLEQAVSLYLNIEKTVAEGAGAAALGALLVHPERFRGRKVALVLSGGNIDSRLLASLLMRSLVREGRITRLRVQLSDIPGALGKVATILGTLGGNIIDVSHHRLFSQLPAKETFSDVTLETRDRQHLETILTALREAGFEVHIKNADTNAG
ncbi:threonine ammonia-lyase [Govanella unica]|uniref:Threonine ammonia-lyase n=1 Tax=Govanella unica TaxID=2975056 RepID=A0A9X3Z7D9_9PROT|nr:threonine ammonia-lyase [Govania unica]MDA5194071.1 threonine ammonia-lyase [Govania unica]